MRRNSALKVAATGTALALLSLGGASAVADEETAEPTAVVNKNGKQVDEHAAFGQERAAEARAQRFVEDDETDAPEDTGAEDTEVEDTEDTEVKDTEDTEVETDEPADEETDEPAPGQEQTDNGNHGGPDESAGDHPNENAFTHPAHETPRGPKAEQGPRDGHGPDENAGDHPNVNALNGPGNNGQKSNNGQGPKGR